MSGSDATIRASVTLGDGASMAAQFMVPRDVPPYAIVAGNPATVVRMRAPPEVAVRLKAVAWWDWDIARITCCPPAISGGDLAAPETEAIGGPTGR